MILETLSRVIEETLSTLKERMLIDSILSDLPHNERPGFLADCAFLLLIGNGLNRYLEDLSA